MKTACEITTSAHTGEGQPGRDWKDCLFVAGVAAKRFHPRPGGSADKAQGANDASRIELVEEA